MHESMLIYPTEAQEQVIGINDAISEQINNERVPRCPTQTTGSRLESISAVAYQNSTSSWPSSYDRHCFSSFGLKS